MAGILAQCVGDRDNRLNRGVVIVIKCNKNKFRETIVKHLVVVLQAFAQDWYVGYVKLCIGCKQTIS